MRYSDNYELNLVEGSDIVNPLVQDVPNYEAIDAAMFDNKEHTVGVATELKTGTVHALTRQNEDAAVFRFTATSDYTAGDTFEVDGVQVSALLVDGTALPNRCYIIGSEVLASLKGTLLTVYANRTTASDSDKLGGQLPAYYATKSDLDLAEDVIEAHTSQINSINGNLANMANVRNVTALTTVNITPNSDGTFQLTAPQLVGKMPTGSTIIFNGSHTGTSPVNVFVTAIDNSAGVIFGTAYPKSTATFQTGVVILAPIS